MQTYEGSVVSSQATTTSTFMNRVYGWMTLAMLITGMMAYTIYSSPAALNAIYSNSMILILLVVAQVGLVLYFSVRLMKMSYASALGVFLAYSALNGAMLSSLFVIYTTSSLAFTFLIAAGTFFIMASIGYATKRDLSGLGMLCLMMLVGVILTTLVNMIFLHSAGLDMLITYAAIAVFVGLIAYDANKLKQMSAQIANPNDEQAKKLALMGALSLYLDFINLFLYLLKLFGNQKD